MRVSQTVHDIVGYQVSDLISQKIMTVNKASDWLIHNLGTVNTQITNVVIDVSHQKGTEDLLNEAKDKHALKLPSNEFDQQDPLPSRLVNAE